MFDVTLLGTGGMMPMPNRYLTSLLCRQNGHLLLIDCGEGTQVSMRENGWGFKNIEIICITHFHADHIAGLPGLLLTIGNSEKKTPLHIIGPPGLRKIVEGLTVITPELTYPLEIHECSATEITEIELFGYHIKSLPVDHGITCLAYSLELKRKAKFDITKAQKLPIPVQLYSKLQNGESVEHKGITYKPNEVMGDDREGIKVSYCTDSRPTKELPDFVRDSDLFVCEGMYGDMENIERVKGYMHMVFPEGAKIAKEGNVKELWFTHFSPAFLDPHEHIEETRKIFPNAHVGKAHKLKNLTFSDVE